MSDAGRKRHWQDLLTAGRSRPEAPLKVGLRWRSGLVNAQGSRHYLDMSELLPLLQIPGVELYSVQHGIDPREETFCRENGIRLLEDIDLTNDFETVCAVTSCLDLVVGISSSAFEIAAAAGPPCWLIAISAEAAGLRLGDSQSCRDRLSWNTTVILPKSVCADDAGGTYWPREEALLRTRIMLEAHAARHASTADKCPPVDVR